MLVLGLTVHGNSTFLLLVRIKTVVFAVFDAFDHCVVNLEYLCSSVQYCSGHGLFLVLVLLSIDMRKD